MFSDHKLVTLAQRGDRDAFGHLAQRYRAMCIRLGYTYLHNRADAEDQTQNALLKAYERIHQFHGEAEFSTWLARIAINECLMALRSRRRAPPFVRANEWRNRLRSIDRNPEERCAFAEWRRFVRREAARVPRLLRPALAHDLDDGLTVPQLAQRLGVSIACAKSRLFRARAELRSRVSVYG